MIARKTVAYISCCVLMILMVGCSASEIRDNVKKPFQSKQANSDDQDLKDAQQKDRAAGTGAGAVIGGVAGGIIGKELAEDNPLLSDSDAVIAGSTYGAAIGGSVGKEVGDEMAVERGEYAQELGDLDAAILKADQDIVSLSLQINNLESQVSSHRARIVENDQKAETEDEKAEDARGIRDGIAESIITTEAAKETTENNIKILRDQIAHADQLLLDYPEASDVRDRRDQLALRRDNFLESLKRLTAVEGSLVVQGELIASDE